MAKAQSKPLNIFLNNNMEQDKSVISGQLLFGRYLAGSKLRVNKPSYCHFRLSVDKYSGRYNVPDFPHTTDFQSCHLNA